MSTVDLKSPDLFISRELSWLEFNDRVLRQGLAEDVPPLGRLKFLAIVSSNLDEFFMVRVAGLMQQRSAGVERRDPAGLTPGAQLAHISRRTHRMVAEQSEGICRVLEELVDHGLEVFERANWTPGHRSYLSDYFTRHLLPVLTPLAMEDLDPCPLLPGLQLHVAAVLASGKEDGPQQGGEKIVAVPVPTQFPRFVKMPADGKVELARLGDVIADNLQALFPGRDVLTTALFRITRDGDVSISDDDVEDLLRVVESAVIQRRRREPVRLEISTGCDRRLRDWIVKWLDLDEVDIYEIEGMLDASALWEIVTLEGFDDLLDPDWPPQPPQDLLGADDDLWQAIQDRDILLFHPYESFEPVVKLLELAAKDPRVLTIKQCLYRTSGESPIVKSLEQAAQSGKEVTVLVELKARFDEAQNVNWARQLEDAGCHVIYGIAGLKTHAKALLIVRRESDRIRRYVHLATGNYNDKTAKLYSDIGLLTCDHDLANDVAAFFNLLTGYSENVGWSKLSVAPTGLRQRFLELIDREIQTSTPDHPGLIMAKMNSLEDRRIIEALYRASQAGVLIRLNVRGICCLRPGVKGVSHNIEVTSIIDRYLEHARIFYFRNGGHEEVYLGSADWMRRNLSKRLEILFPVVTPTVAQRLIGILQTCLGDNARARFLASDGTYEPVRRNGPRVCAQEKFYHDAVEATRIAEQSAVQFRPLKRPQG